MPSLVLLPPNEDLSEKWKNEEKQPNSFICWVCREGRVSRKWEQGSAPKKKNATRLYISRFLWDTVRSSS